jgi:hypothetical protein
MPKLFDNKQFKPDEWDALLQKREKDIEKKDATEEMVDSQLVAMTRQELLAVAEEKPPAPAKFKPS